MSQDSTNQVTIDIDRMIWSSPSNPLKTSISNSKFNNYMRSNGQGDINNPQILALGPYQNRKHSPHKYRYLKQLLRRKNEQSVDRYVIAITKLEKNARECYCAPLDLNENEFVKMMVLDGCFLIELFRYYAYPSLRDIKDPIFNDKRILNQLRHDIVLIDNQLPFVVLNELYNLTGPVVPGDFDLIRLILYFFYDKSSVNFSTFPINKQLRKRDFDHLLSLIHHNLCDQNYVDEYNSNHVVKWKNIPSISKLVQIGVKIKPAKAAGLTTFDKEEERRLCNMMDIKFVDRTLLIPRLNISYEIESQLRNFIAYEQCFTERSRPRYVSDYVFFMHCFIKTDDDFERLHYNKIIGSWIGDINMFNRLAENIVTSPRFCYSRIFNDVNEEYERLDTTCNCVKRMFYLVMFVVSPLVLVCLLLVWLTRNGRRPSPCP